MIEWARFKREQHRIQREMDKVSRAHREAERKARANRATAEELHELGYGFIIEHKLLDDEYVRLTSSYYVRLANRMLIPVPEFQTKDGAWMESQESPGLYHLTPEALHSLRSAIRAEKKARREEWTVWLASLTGLVGALSGLVAIIKK